MLTKTDLAKYPFTKEAAEYVKKLGIKAEELTLKEFDEVMERAEGRIKESIKEARISKNWLSDDVEILSFPAAILLLSGIESEWIKRRYALSEAKRAYEFLVLEDEGKLLQISKGTFGWKVEPVEDGFFNFKLHFSNYLKNATKIKDAKWKLVNKPLSKGYVFITRGEAARLLEEEIQRKILGLTRNLNVDPAKFEDRVKRITELSEKTHVNASAELPKTVIPSAFPSCIKRIHETIASGAHVPHIGRFTLTSFLLNIGVTPDELTKLFKEVSDFNEEKTRYQVEHIGGMRGAGIKYTPPKCSTLKTYGLCFNPDELCKKINHPLSYYRKAAKLTLRKGGNAPRRSVH
ncbi:TPA: DNA primase regulatory subunit PriL [Candidatus Bathyarchaeota archaeon]|nr:DNA primase regulatory subunit PriL [Candidatus Bathyarchaeota archaeon]